MVLKANFLSSLALFIILVSAQSSASYQKTCQVPSKYSSSNGTANDSPAITQAFAKCGNNGVIAFAEGVDYNVLTPISATNLSNVEIRMYGNLNLPRNVSYVRELYNATTGGSGNLYWFEFAGSKVSYVSTPNVTTGWINSYGQAWWDANPANGTGIDGRPHLMYWDITSGHLDHLKSHQPIAWNFRLEGSNITVTNSIVNAYSTTASFPFNTDGFDIAGTDITITDSVIYNGDDAFAIANGAHNIHIQRATIGYQSHGLSIGSLGQNQASFANVSNVLFDDITVIDAVYAARFKSWIGGQGLAKNITWQNIRVYNATFPIFVTQTYINQGGSQTQIENGTTVGRPNNSTVMMEDFRWVNFTGTVNTYAPGDGSCVTDPCWYDVGLPNLTHTEAIIVECNTDTSCKNFQMSNIQVFPQSADSSTVICLNATAELNPELGFACQNGTFVPTA